MRSRRTIAVSAGPSPRFPSEATFWVSQIAGADLAIYETPRPILPTGLHYNVFVTVQDVALSPKPAQVATLAEVGEVFTEVDVTCTARIGRERDLRLSVPKSSLFNLTPQSIPGVYSAFFDEGAGSALVSLDGSASYDPDGTIIGYQWYNGPTLLAAGPTPSFVLPDGVYTITLRVTDDSGVSQDANTQVLVNQLPAPDVLHLDFSVPATVTTVSGLITEVRDVVTNDNVFLSKFGGETDLVSDYSSNAYVATPYWTSGTGAGQLSSRGIAFNPRAGVVSLDLATNDATYIVVYGYDARSLNSNYVYNVSVGSSSPGAGYRLIARSSDTSSHSGYDNSTELVTGIPSATGKSVWVIRRSGTEYHHFRNGVLVGSHVSTRNVQTFPLRLESGNTYQAYSLSTQYEGPKRYHEVQVFSRALSDEEIVRMTQALETKWASL